MGELIGESTKSGVCVDGAGLHRSARRVQLAAGGSARSAAKGPYRGDNELVASMALVKTKSMDEAGRQRSGYSRDDRLNTEYLTAARRSDTTSGMGRNMAWRIEGRLNVVVHGPSSPSTLEWSSYLKDVMPLKYSDMRVLVFSHGGSPSGAQRLQLASMIKGREPGVPLALLTDSLLARAIVGALSWVNPLIRAFDLAQIHAACDYLGLTPDEKERARKIRLELEREIDQAVARV